MISQERRSDSPVLSTSTTGRDPAATEFTRGREGGGGGGGGGGLTEVRVPGGEGSEGYENLAVGQVERKTQLTAGMGKSEN